MTPETTETVKTTGRTMGVVLPAAAVTVGLFALMAGLIAEEFQAEDKLQIAELDINPEVEDIAVAERTVKLVELKRVETPPAPPVIEIATTELPGEPIVEVVGAKSAMPAPVLDVSVFQPILSDREPQPLVRIPPQMPPRADKSGHCVVRFDVSPEGQPFNVATTSCTQSMFERPTVRAVQRWRYNPKIQDGRAVGRTGLSTKVRFNLADERGQIIPE